MTKLLVTFCYQREEIVDNLIPALSSPKRDLVTAWTVVNTTEQYESASELWDFITESVEKSLPNNDWFKCSKLSILSISDITNLIKGNKNVQPN